MVAEQQSRARRRPRGIMVVTVLLLALSSTRTLHANAGVFFGSGHTVRLDASEDIQLVREDVAIIPGRNRGLFGGGVPRDWVDYYCQFELRNLTDRTIEVQVGFPLNSQFQSYTKADEYDETSLVQQHRFIARDANNTYHVRFVARDEEQRFKRLFLWTMEFAPGQTLDLHVSYGMDTSISMGASKLAWDVDYPHRWMQALEGCLNESFGYVTETGESWAGEIESARFRVLTGGFEMYLNQRPFYEFVSDDKSVSGFAERPPCMLWDRTVAPEGGSVI